MKKTRLLMLAVASVLTTLTAAVPSAGANGTHSNDATYTVSITNITDGQYLTPANFAAHDPSVRVFNRGQAASPGVQAVAENGGVPVLAAELNAAVDAQGLGVSGVAEGGPLAPGQTTNFDVTTSATRLSIVSMLICTNDGFAGLNSLGLPTIDGQSRVYPLQGYDAGTEINTELKADIVPAPFCQEGAGSGTGESNPALAENGVIRTHKTINGVGDLGENFDWNGPVARIVITRVPAVAEYELTITNLTGQYLTPPNWVTHDRSVDVFQRGQAASPGVQAVAENGAVPVLADELAGAVSAAGFGDSGVAGPDPIRPGQSRTFTISTAADRLSVVSMLICTNDGFAGLDSRALPRNGGNRTYRLQGYDAGTEINTELKADIVPAPFCQMGSGVGTGESNPALAENGVITRHRTLRGVGDLDPGFDWNGAIATLQIRRVG